MRLSHPLSKLSLSELSLPHLSQKYIISVDVAQRGEPQYILCYLHFLQIHDRIYIVSRPSVLCINIWRRLLTSNPQSTPYRIPYSPSSSYSDASTKLKLRIRTIGKGDDEGIRRRGCMYQRDDFLSKESFQSWGNYVDALKQTPGRFMDGVLTRSADNAELVEVKARSHHEMKKTLSWWDFIWFGLGAVIGAGTFMLTGLKAKEHAGPAIMMSYVVSGVSALLSVFCYTEFAFEIPAAECWITSTSGSTFRRRWIF
ncbi:hypothetical protein ACFX2B_040624 [Malus domestica]